MIMYDVGSGVGPKLLKVEYVQPFANQFGCVKIINCDLKTFCIVRCCFYKTHLLVLISLEDFLFFLRY